MVKCPNCGNENKESSRYCEDCGKKLSVEVPKCPHCDAAIGDARFCPSCGREINSGLREVQVDYLKKKKVTHTAGTVVGGVASAAGVGFGIFKLLAGLIAVVLGIAALSLPCMGLFIGIPMIVAGIFFLIIGATATMAGMAAGGAAVYSAKKGADINDKLKGL
ncbi:MAG: zinc ribbon domain-containing protein [Nitrososphaerota archaeon]|nr:zinc ribbon domain-containing protein [Nitrososphaerota archaeon]